MTKTIEQIENEVKTLMDDVQKLKDDLAKKEPINGWIKCGQSYYYVSYDFFRGEPSVYCE